MNSPAPNKTMPASTLLHQLHAECGQSIWIDHLSRDWLERGQLEKWVQNGCRGVTSNPTIFEKSLTSEDAYDADLSRILAEKSSATGSATGSAMGSAVGSATDSGTSNVASRASGRVAGGDTLHTSQPADTREADILSADIESAYWDLVVHDVSVAATELRKVFDTSHGLDGHVSVEVSPALANSADETVAAATALRQRFEHPNIYIKVPATPAGVQTIGPLMRQGVNLNLTLIFSLERYRQVALAYIEALESIEGDLNQYTGVASFFISRVDTMVDAQIVAQQGNAAVAQQSNTAQGNSELLACGKTAIAQAKLAYEIFQQTFSGNRWEKLLARGANPQRPLWASTSTKNPDYPETLYVDSLIGANTVNTLPEATARAFMSNASSSTGNNIQSYKIQCHTITQDVPEAHKLWEQLAISGINMSEVSEILEQQGLTAFEASFNKALEALANKADLLVTQA